MPASLPQRESIAGRGRPFQAKVDAALSRASPAPRTVYAEEWRQSGTEEMPDEGSDGSCYSFSIPVTSLPTPIR